MKTQWKREALRLDPVFIVGHSRSGTSVLYRSIQSHPSFLPSTESLHESHAMDDLWRLVRREDVREGRLSFFLLGLDALAEVAADIEPLALRRRLVRRAARTIARERSMGNRSIRVYQRFPSLWKAAGEHHVVRRYFLEAHRRRGAKRLLDKTPRHVHWVPHLRIAFPNARFIFIIRHPLDVLSSYRKLYKIDPVKAAWANLTPEEVCARWDSATRRAVSLDERDPRFLLLRYEEFVARTEETIRHALDHVGEPFDEACMLQGPDLEPAPAVRYMAREYPQQFSSVKENTKRWEDYLDRVTAADVERRLSDSMALVGYESRSQSEPSGD